MSNKSLLILLATSLLVFSCSKDKISDETLPQPESANQPATREQINEFALSQLREHDVFKWEMADDHLLWSAVMRGDELVAIGYKPANEGDITARMHLIDISDDAWQAARQKIIKFVVEEMNRDFPNEKFTAESLMPLTENGTLPFINMRITSERVLAALRQMPEVRYVEPSGYSFADEGDEQVTYRSDAGCSNSAASSIPTADYVTVSPSVKVPWNFYNASIPTAWNTSTGAGITIAIIDTGTSPSQTKLGSEFASGQSTGRTITRMGTYVSSWWPWASPDGPDDQCGHGTQMAGLATAPRGSGGASVGVAYRANLLAIRGTGDVIINGSSEKTGVANALVIAGNNSGVKIISMSIGDVFWSSQVADGVYYAYGQGKLIFSAAGTSTWFTSWVGVIFPATMNEVVAVTGVKDGATLVKCNTCHSGSKVDFVAVMQRSVSDSRTSLTLAMSGNPPAYVGGSSAATATTAGIAALVWATNPSQSRTQVLNRMKNASQFYPGRNGEFGWGIVNAATAVTN